MGVYKYDANGFVIADRNRLSNYRIMDILHCAVDFNNPTHLRKAKSLVRVKLSVVVIFFASLLATSKNFFKKFSLKLQDDAD